MAESNYSQIFNICPPEFCNIRKDKLRARDSGVAILFEKDWTMKNVPNMDSLLVCLSVKFTTTTSVLLLVLYYLLFIYLFKVIFHGS